MPSTRGLWPLVISIMSFSIGSLALPDKKNYLRLLYEYPKGTWVENLAIRSNGDLLLTRLDVPALDLLDPFDDAPRPVRLETFEKVTGLTGIAEIAPDSFALAAGNLSFSDLSESTFNSWAVWNVRFDTAGGKNVAPQNIENLVKTCALVSQVVVHGDKRKFLSAIVTVDPDALKTFAVSRNLGGGSYAELNRAGMEEWRRLTSEPATRDMASFPGTVYVGMIIPMR